MFNVIAMTLFRALVVAILFVGVFEFVCRIAYPEWRSLTPQPFLKTDGDAVAGVPNFIGRLTDINGDFDVPLSLDGLGYRNSPGMTPFNSDIFVVGDSFAFGWGVQQVETFAAVLGRETATSVFNFGVPATDLSDYLATVTRFVDAIRTKILVVAVTLENDLLDYSVLLGGERKTNDALNLSALVSAGIRASALVTVSATYMSRNATLVSTAHSLGLMTPGMNKTGSADRNVRESIKLLRQIKSSSGAQYVIVLVIPPRPERVAQTEVVQFVSSLREEGLITVEMTAKPGDFYPYDGHWTANAHERAGQAIAERIISLRDE